MPFKLEWVLCFRTNIKIIKLPLPSQKGYKVQLKIDENIIKGCIENKRVAQYALYKKHNEPFMRICLRYTKSRDEAAEILNSAFLKIFSKINTFSFQGDFEAWMRRIIVNTALDHLKSEKKYYQQADVTELTDLVDSSHDHLHAEDLLKMINSLPAIQTSVFNLFALEGHSHREIAEILKITEALSKWHLFNARKTLQEMVNKLN